jgi:hypothetical protein
MPGLVVSTARGQVINGPASDFMTTPAGNTVELHADPGSGGVPIPPGFFGPGSDPWIGVINLHGEPLTNGAGVTPGNWLAAQADTIVQRLGPAAIPVTACPATAQVPIQIVALALTSWQPITVTFGGGLNPTLYCVDVCLSSMTAPQPVGQMVITKLSPLGGRFTSILPVVPRFIFTKGSIGGPGLPQIISDPGPTVQLNGNGTWNYGPGPLMILASPAGVVDHDCNAATPPVPFLPTSNFIVSVNDVGGTCAAGGVPQKDLTPEQEMLAKHGVLPPCRPPGFGYCFGTAVACPCGNAGVAGHGCEHSFGLGGALLFGSGEAKVSADSLLLRCENLPPTTAVLFFQGTLQAGGGLGLVFGDGLRCAAGAVIRLATKNSVCSKANYGVTIGDVAVSIRGAIPAAGGTRDYQAWYRNAAAFCTPSTFNLSNGYEIVWMP